MRGDPDDYYGVGAEEYVEEDCIRYLKDRGYTVFQEKEIRDAVRDVALCAMGENVPTYYVRQALVYLNDELDLNLSKLSENYGKHE